MSMRKGPTLFLTLADTLNFADFATCGRCLCSVWQGYFIPRLAVGGLATVTSVVLYDLIARGLGADKDTPSSSLRGVGMALPSLDQ